jgi:hypothetical protein
MMESGLLINLSIAVAIISTVSFAVGLVVGFMFR